MAPATGEVVFGIARRRSERHEIPPLSATCPAVRYCQKREWLRTLNSTTRDDPPASRASRGGSLHSNISSDPQRRKDRATTASPGGAARSALQLTGRPPSRNAARVGESR